MRILVFQHLAVEHPGAFTALWTAAGHAITTVELDEGAAIPDVTAFDLMVAMGGPMDVWQEAELPWLAHEKAAIARFVAELGRPYLGICLGHQLLATALETIQLLSEFARERMPQHLPAVLELIEPFGETLAAHYG